jgi:glycosyltransferase involved in cell wall biosynthesis
MSYAPILTEPTLIDPKKPTLSFHNSTSSSKKSTAANKTAGQKSDSESLPIIVHCHLCWDWVWQRPQQFLSRLSRNHRILFVETIAPDAQLAIPAAKFRTVAKFPNITILQLQFPLWRWGDGAYVDAQRRRIVKEFVDSGPLAGEFKNPIQWFYDPMAVTAFAGEMNEALTVYDCMDELSKFKCAPSEIVQREKKLLAIADVVFTGGRRLFESKSLHNDNCHFYGCGVDNEHFGKARRQDTSVPEGIRPLKKPLLGYFGVVDERMDYELVAKLADANPEWSVTIVGPVLKVDAKSLPQRANLHWLGQQDYNDLPAFCKGFDICLMPFAMNESTEFINPTKALEYMATGRPIVSTPVPDVVRNFGSVVKIGSSSSEFIELCRRAVQEPDKAAIDRGLTMASENSWERIVGCLEQHMAEALDERKKAMEAA